VDLAENLFTQDISAATSISYSSDREVVGFQLNGSSGGMMLDALPALAGVQPPGTCSPEVTDWSPRGSVENTRPNISATISSPCGVDIDQDSIEMTFNYGPVPPTVSGSGSEVTASYQVTEPPLIMDRNYEVTVSAGDINGETVEKTWVFYVPLYY